MGVAASAEPPKFVIDEVNDAGHKVKELNEPGGLLNCGFTKDYMHDWALYKTIHAQIIYDLFKDKVPLLFQNLLKCGSPLSSSSESPWILFSAGAPAAGKGTVIRTLSGIGLDGQPTVSPLQAARDLIKPELRRYLFDLSTEEFLSVDVDEFRYNLPNFEALADADAPLYQKVGGETQAEAGLLAEITRYLGIKYRTNIIYDSSLKDTAYNVNVVKWFREHGYRVGVVHVVGDFGTCKARAAERAIKQKRGLPDVVIQTALDNCPITVKALRDENLLDLYMEFQSGALGSLPPNIFELAVPQGDRNVMWAVDKLTKICAAPGCFHPSSSTDRYCSKRCFDAQDGSAPVCKTPGCGKPTWNGKQDDYCGKKCRDVGLPTCLAPGCGKPTWNGRPNGYCSKACKGKSGQVPTCMAADCGKPTWNGRPNGFCGKACRDRLPHAGYAS